MILAPIEDAVPQRKPVHATIYLIELNGVTCKNESHQDGGNIPKLSLRKRISSRFGGNHMPYQSYAEEGNGETPEASSNNGARAVVYSLQNDSGPAESFPKCLQSFPLSEVSCDKDGNALMTCSWPTDVEGSDSKITFVSGSDCCINSESSSIILCMNGKNHDATADVIKESRTVTLRVGLLYPGEESIRPFGVTTITIPSTEQNSCLSLPLLPDQGKCIPLKSGTTSKLGIGPKKIFQKEATRECNVLPSTNLKIQLTVRDQPLQNSDEVSGVGCTSEKKDISRLSPEKNEKPTKIKRGRSIFNRFLQNRSSRNTTKDILCKDEKTHSQDERKTLQDKHVLNHESFPEIMVVQTSPGRIQDCSELNVKSNAPGDSQSVHTSHSTPTKHDSSTKTVSTDATSCSSASLVDEAILLGQNGTGSLNIFASNNAPSIEFTLSENEFERSTGSGFKTQLATIIVSSAEAVVSEDVPKDKEDDSPRASRSIASNKSNNENTKLLEEANQDTASLHDNKANTPSSCEKSHRTNNTLQNVKSAPVTEESITLEDATFFFSPTRSEAMADDAGDQGININSLLSFDNLSSFDDDKSRNQQDQINENADVNESRLQIFTMQELPIKVNEIPNNEEFEVSVDGAKDASEVVSIKTEKVKGQNKKELPQSNLAEHETKSKVSLEEFVGDFIELKQNQADIGDITIDLEEAIFFTKNQWKEQKSECDGTSIHVTREVAEKDNIRCAPKFNCGQPASVKEIVGNFVEGWKDIVANADENLCDGDLSYTDESSYKSEIVTLNTFEESSFAESNSFCDPPRHGSKPSRQSDCKRRFYERHNIHNGSNSVRTGSRSKSAKSIESRRRLDDIEKIAANAAAKTGFQCDEYSVDS